MTANAEGQRLRTLLVLPTARHVDAALRASGEPGRAATTLWALRAEAADAVLGPRRVADAATTRLAAGLALDRVATVDDRGASGEAEIAARCRLAFALDATLGTLRAAGTPADALREAASARGPHVRRVAAVNDDVERALQAAGLVDRRAVGAELAARAARGEAVEAVVDAEIGRVVVAGFTSIDGDTRALLEVIHAVLRARGGAGVRLDLPRFVADPDATTVFADALERVWASLDDAPEITWSKVEDVARRSVVTARDEVGEARAAARAAASAIAAGTPPERIAIGLLGLDEATLEPLRAALTDAGVPFREPRGRGALATPEGRVVRALLAIAVGPVARDDVLELLRAPGVRVDAWTGTGERPGARGGPRALELAHRLTQLPISVDPTGAWLVEALARDLDARKADARKTDAKDADAKKLDAKKPDTKKADAWMPGALKTLLGLARYVGEGGSRAAIAARLVAVLERLSLGRPDARALRAALAARDGGLALAALGGAARAGRAILGEIEAWRAAAEVLGVADAKVTAARARAELEGALRSTSAHALGAAAEAGAVRIARASDLAGLRHDLLIVLGLVEGAEAAQGDSGFLDDALRRDLPAGLRPAARATQVAARRAELAWALAGATDLVLTHAVGTDVEPAPAHAVVRAALASADTARREEPLSRVGTSVSILDARGAELVALSRGATADKTVEARARAERDRLAFFLEPTRPSGPTTGRFAVDDAGFARARASLGGASPDATISVTAIEKGASCGFQLYAHRVLRARRRDEAAEAGDPRQRGLTVHAALHAAFEAIFRGATFRDDAARLSAARAAAEDAVDLASAAAPLRRYALGVAVDDAMVAVEAALASGDPLRFSLAERRFGPREAPPWSALALEGDGGDAVHVDGQIDRVDTAGRRARVVDYKTGSKRPTLDEHGKVAFQLPLYAAVVERALGAEHVEAVYVQVKQRGAVDAWPKKADDRERVAAHGADVIQAARAVVLRAWRGEAGPRPAKAATCSRCEARDICRRPAVAPDAADDA